MTVSKVQPLIKDGTEDAMPNLECIHPGFSVHTSHVKAGYLASFKKKAVSGDRGSRVWVYDWMV